MTDHEEHSCLNRLPVPSRKSVLVALLVIATAMTLVLVHVTGQWVGHRVFAQAYHPREQVVNSWEESRKNTGDSWLRSRDGRRKNKDILSEKQPPPQQLLGGSDKEENMPDGVDFAPGKMLPSNDIIGERQRLDSLTEKHRGVMNLPSRSQTNRASPSDVLRGSVPSKGIVLNPEDDQQNYLQGMIRKEMVPSPLDTPTFSRRNDHQWNERDPKALTRLPFRQKGDREWKVMFFRTQKEDALIFNRVGKCGSRTVISILQKLSDMNNFHLISSLVYNQTHLSTSWQGGIVRILEKVKTPYLFQRHLHFVDFTEFNAKQPMYINIIRDPLARFVSNYYFKRFGDGRSIRKYKGSNETRDRSVTDCIVNGHKECITSGIIYIIPFFCGQLKKCREPTQWALDRAKENVEKHFVAVGILEDMENSFRVFEKVLPQYFTGAVQLLLKPDEKQVLKNGSTTTKFKEKPSEEATTIMKHLMYYEYEFYHFIKDRLEKQMAYYGIKR
ncbi:uronyl 2-sulfotransferase-like [Patiria miniata]|uniref:Uncharacterized protein n=1 Tax=Patiria miniata TaxID=46514 RepID=A0A914A6Q7_PATMI|nr:uronyl 2-sulfotransferase-like [Patiria miniata]